MYEGLIENLNVRRLVTLVFLLLVADKVHTQGSVVGVADSVGTSGGMAFKLSCAAERAA